MKKIIPLLLLLALILVGCSSQPEVSEPPSQPPATQPPTPEPTPSPTPEPDPFRNPLSGEIVEEEPGNNRPYAVMINNISVALPHVGISRAEIIYEVLAEGEITRMMPVFTDISDVGIIGSMRSARPYYIELALSYDAIYVHAGGSEQAYSDISVKRVDNIDGVRGAYGAEIFYRDPDRMKNGYEHSLFTTSEKLLEYTPILGYEAEHSTPDYDYGLSFSDEIEMKNALPASSVIVSFSGLKTTDFTYGSDGYYIASQYGKELYDAGNDETLRFKNLIVLYARTTILDNEGRRSVELTGTGDGHFICNGEMVDITWGRSGNGEQFSYYLSDGTPLTLGVGKTYIGIVPTGSVITAQ